MSQQKLFIGQGISPALYNADGSPYGAPNWPDVPLSKYVWGILFLLFAAGFFQYWTTIPLILTQFEHGYPNTNSDAFQSARYTLHWWIVWGLTLNALPPLFLAFALLNNLTTEWSRLHKLFSTFCLVTNTVVFVLATVQWAVYCNNGVFAVGATSVNDPRWCCVYWPSVWCQNTAACDPVVTTLARNREALQHWAFAIVFFVLDCWHRLMNGYLTSVGVLH
jgi:hypothetical protein